MMEGVIALIGLGAIGVPIADKLYQSYQGDFVIVASGSRRKRYEEQEMYINGKTFKPQVISKAQEVNKKIILLIVCVKNYDLDTAIKDIKNVVDDETIILPLQNGLDAYSFFCKEFPNNTILQGYVQGPNTIINNGEFYYKNPGVLHLGNPSKRELEDAKYIFELLNNANVSICYEDRIKRMAWKKWMLNVAGNSVTALTDADYSLFKSHPELQEVCRSCMREFLQIAQIEEIELDETDIEDVIDYYVTYCGHKQTSMLVDVQNKRRTENKYLAGSIVKKAEQYGIYLPVTTTLYYLVKIKEDIYLGN